MVKWEGIEIILPSQPDAQVKFEHSSPVPQSNNVPVQDTASVGKVSGSVVSDLIKNVPLLTDSDPENILKFLIQLKEVHDLKWCLILKFGL
jgi:hypothetical protein